MSDPETDWWPHPDAELERMFALGQASQLQRLFRHPRVAPDPYARLRILDRLHDVVPDHATIEMAWMQAMLLGNRPTPVWQTTRHWSSAEADLARLLLAAQVAQVMGKTKEARQRYLDMLQRFPGSVDAWQKYIEFERPERLPFSHPDPLERLYCEAISDYEQEKAAFALARYWQERQPGLGFRFASEAHALKRRRTGRWDRYGKQQILDSDRRWQPQPAPPAPTHPRPLFVVGLPRSGTTLLSSVLAAHSAIANVGEQNLIPSLAAGPCRMPGAPDPRLRGFVQAWYRAAVGDMAGSADVVVDKLPGNAEHCGLILSMLPDAVIVHIERALPDCALSIHLHDFEFGCRYADNAADLAAYAALLSIHLAHWRSLAPDRVLHIRFEDLVTNAEQTLAPVMAALGLAWEPAMLDFWQRRDKIGTYSEAQVRRPLNRDGIGSWRRFLPDAKPFFEALGIQA